MNSTMSAAGRVGLAVLSLAACLAGPSALSAQDVRGREVVYGRVVDADTREPVPGAQVIAGDSSVVVSADSAGLFAISLPRTGTFSVFAEQVGYVARRFDLGPNALDVVNELALEPAPFGIAAMEDISGRAVVYGRVVDAATLVAVPGALVMAADSSVVVAADTLGNFAIPVPRAETLSVFAERLGYLVQRFELGPNALAQINVLALEPAPFEIAAIEVEVEAALTRLTRNLRSRRASAGTAARGYDRAWLNRFGPVGGSVMDLVFQRVPRMRECDRAMSMLCVPGRGVSFRNPFPEDEVLVCIDERKSWAPASELSSLLVADVALVEIFGRSHVRVYTSIWMLSRSARGHTMVTALSFGC